MPQLPTMPSMQVGADITQPMQSPGSIQLPNPSEHPETKTFQLSLQESLEEGSIDASPLLNWFATLQIDQATTPVVLESGKFMPLRGMIDGKMLPGGVDNDYLQAQLGGVSVEDLPSSGRLPAPQSKFHLEQLMLKTETGEVPALTRSTDNLLHSSDEESNAHLIGRFATPQSQSLFGNAHLRSSMTMLSVDVPVGQPDWGKSLGDRVQWMVGQNIQQAEVKLTPPHLGPLEIRISVQNDQASVSFIAAQAPTREALEAAIPRLREMFGDINLNLADVDVNQRDASGDSPQDMRGVKPGNSQDMDVAKVALEDTAVNISRSGVMGLVDDYA